jgi:hypothetical protein
MRRSWIMAGAVLAALLVATPAAAIDNTFTCGAVEDTTATIDGTAYFAADGSWIKDILRFSYDASFTDPATGQTMSFTTRQVVVASPENLSFLGQGLFVRAPGSGAVLLDVGRLTIDPSDGSTVFASANVLSFDDPTVPDRYDAAICSLF